MELSIPNHFDNFEQRKMSRGMETKSTTEYKGYLIVLRCYPMSGISAKIVKVVENKRYICRERAWNFMIPTELLQKTKDYIDNYEFNLIANLNRKLERRK